MERETDMKRKIAMYNSSTRLAETLNSLFEKECMNLVVASTLKELLQLIKNEDIHLILLGIELERIGLRNGIKTINLIRRCTVIPIIVISSHTAEAAKIMSFNVGVDDYITAYDSPLFILDRVKAQIRRYTKLEVKNNVFNNVYRIGELILDDNYHVVMVRGSSVSMTPTEYKILRFLMQNRGKIFSINQIYEKIWQMQACDIENIVQVHICHIREKIERNPKEPQYLKVVRGCGYKVG